MDGVTCVYCIPRYEVLDLQRERKERGKKTKERSGPKVTAVAQPLASRGTVAGILTIHRILPLHT